MAGWLTPALMPGARQLESTEQHFLWRAASTSCLHPRTVCGVLRLAFSTQVIIFAVEKFVSVAGLGARATLYCMCLTCSGNRVRGQFDFGWLVSGGLWPRVQPLQTTHNPRFRSCLLRRWRLLTSSCCSDGFWWFLSASPAATGRGPRPWRVEFLHVAHQAPHSALVGKLFVSKRRFALRALAVPSTEPGDPCRGLDSPPTPPPPMQPEGT